MVKRLGIVGLGLIGGSIGLAARKRRVAQTVIGYSRSQRTIREALRRHAIDRAARSLGELGSQADLVILATPVGLIESMAHQLIPVLKPGTLLTDVGSAKANIVAKIEKMVPGTILYAGSHPLAGSEKRGMAFARPDLFVNALTIVTKTRRTPKQALDGLTAFWRRLGSRVGVMSPTRHDAILARTSHLPHLIAVSLIHSLKPGDRPFTASGFKDLTRIAASSPVLWRDILLANTGEVLEAIKRFERSLATLKRAIRSSGTLTRLLLQAQRTRQALQ